MYHKNKSARSADGFTIVELLMAMAFLSMLLIVITLTVIQISNIYNKGLTMRAVNQSGTTISADVRETLSQSRPFDVDTSFFLLNSNDGITVNPADAWGGRLCTGSYSYIWNLGRAGMPVNTYVNSTKPIGFVRIRDVGAQYCASVNSKIDDSAASDPREFLSTDPGSEDLAIQSFAITPVATDTGLGQSLYHIIFEIGTNNHDAIQDPNIDTIDTTCKPPTDDEALQDFCAVNQFDFTAQAGNRGGQ